MKRGRGERGKSGKANTAAKPAGRASRGGDPVARERESGLRARLDRVARDLSWTWSPDAPALWARVAEALPAARRDVPAAGDLRRNPVALLRRLGSPALARLEADRSFLDLLRAVEAHLRLCAKPLPPPAGLDLRRPVAYFSMEFGLHESVPLFAGGLGILAGDHLKSAADLAVPLAGVSLLYQRGYFRQHLDAGGRQEVVYSRTRVDELPLEPLRPGGRELRLRVELPGRDVVLRAWKLRVGRCPLYLLDSDVPQNSARDRALLDRLYVGDRETRLAQELIAGVGGVRLLRALGIRPGVWHLNEGHVALLALERLRELRRSSRLSVPEALEVIAADTVFTTHTPVPEGNEAFDLALAERYLRPHTEACGMAVEDFLSLGLDHDREQKPVLSLTVLALRLSRLRNGVSALHGEVSRRMWAELWPGLRAEEVPIASITNGVHTPSWVAPEYDRIYREELDTDWTSRLADLEFWKQARRLPLERLWGIKQALKRDLVRFVRERELRRLERIGASAQRRRQAAELLDPEALTIGFARRFALYKRAALVFRDLDRARRLFGSPRRPVQLIFSGKPHPEDPQGKALFEEVAAFSEAPGLRGRVVLLEDYDPEVARCLVRGVDVWLNNPRRPLEASGTSGQKVPVNCGLNLSILDGWWCEGYAPEVGWCFGEPRDYEDPARQDEDDHAALLDVLEKEVVPLYYRRDRRGVPREWMRRVRAAIERLVPRFSTHHMVSQYVEQLYRPALENGSVVAESGFALARELAAWTEKVKRCWPLVHVRSASWLKPGRQGTVMAVDAYLDGLLPEDFVCLDERGGVLAILKAERAGDATRFEIEASRRPRRGAPSSYRLLPSHPEMVHLQELGLSCRFIL